MGGGARRRAGVLPLAGGGLARTCPRIGFTHVVAYGRSSALGAVVVDTLLDAASHGPQGRWLLLQPEARA